MAKYLLFFSTYHPVPSSSIIDLKVKENIEKGGDATNNAFWNWTPEQKDLLMTSISRIIMRSHWSTGKTRILFEKAKMLAVNGKAVIFVLYYSSTASAGREEDEYLGDGAPILLYCSLMNEIDQGKDSVKSNMKLMVTNDLEKDVLNTMTDSNVNIFIDEYVVDQEKDLETINQICSKIDKENFLWLSLAKVSKDVIDSCQAWLKKKVEKGECYVPTLKYALRNTKEIVDFECSLSLEINLETANEMDPADLLSTEEATMTEEATIVEEETSMAQKCVPQKLDELNSDLQQTVEIALKSAAMACQIYGLPTQSWPSTDLVTPSNLCYGYQVHELTQSSESLMDAMQECFHKLPAQRVLVIVFAKNLSSSGLIGIIKEIRGHEPLVVDKGSKNLSAIRNWLASGVGEPCDLIASSEVMAGFEWPSVLIITSKHYRSQFYLRNIVMRAMSRLVWFKTSFLGELYEIDILGDIKCASCKMIGAEYHCTHCVDYDMCEDCHSNVGKNCFHIPIGIFVI